MALNQSEGGGRLQHVADVDCGWVAGDCVGGLDLVGKILGEHPVVRVGRHANHFVQALHFLHCWLDKHGVMDHS